MEQDSISSVVVRLDGRVAMEQDSISSVVVRVDGRVADGRSKKFFAFLSLHRYPIHVGAYFGADMGERERRPSQGNVISMCVVVARMAEGGGTTRNWHQLVGTNVTQFYQHRELRSGRLN